MEIRVQHGAFKAQRLAVETAGWLGWPRLSLDGSPVSLKAKSIRADDGTEIPFQLKYYFNDPVPKLILGGDTVQLAPPLKWYEQLWLALPIACIAVGGALGGLLGALGLIANGRIFRSNRSTPAKYGLTAIVTIGAFIALVVLSIALRRAMGR